MIRLFTRTPKPATISLDEHERIVADLEERHTRLGSRWEAVVRNNRALQIENGNLKVENIGLLSDVRVAEAAYEESRKSHQRVAQELSAARAKLDRILAPLAAANARRKAQAGEKG